MAENKIFAGPRIRRIRNGAGLTQTAMADRLGISPSYLNLIERNQRPLTVQLLLKLSEIFGADLGDLGGAERPGMLTELRGVFADPLLAGELPGDQELAEIADAAPNAALAVAKLYRAYREQLARLSDLSALLAREGHQTGMATPLLPVDEVRAVFERRPNYFAAIDSAAEALHARLAPGDDLAGALRSFLRKEHEISVRVLPVQTMPNWRRRFDRHSRRLFLSERLGPAERLVEIATEAVLVDFAAVIAAEAASFPFASAEAARLARIELTRYAALALVMPYGLFQTAAERAAYDVDLLSGRFQVGFAEAAFRLTTLQRQSAPGLPFFFLEVDGAGNRMRRAGARGFPDQRFGAACPKLGLYAALGQPGEILAERAEMPDGAEFLTVSRTVDSLAAGFGERKRRTAVLIGCEAAHARDTVYGAALGERRAPIGIGPGCRLCERQSCPSRAEPPLTRPLGLDEAVGGLTAFDFS